MDFIELSPPHEDLIHDIAFDYYGKRFATCSSDKHIKIWTLNTNPTSNLNTVNSLNNANSTNNSNNDAVSNLWVSYDIPRAHQNSIWRLCWANPEYGQLLASCSEDNTICLWEEQESTTTADSSQDKWRKFKIASHKRSINDIKFCHRSLGLKLASVCGDGFIRLYEAIDIFDMDKWETIIEYQVEDTTSTDSNKKNSSEHGLTCCCWNDCPFEPAKIAVGGYSKVARVLSLEKNMLKEECILGEHNNAVNDIAWAPSMGRSYHLIATASRESTFKIHKLQRKDDGSLEYLSTQSVESKTKSNIWRISWNATGTVLATAAEDGTLSLWRRDFTGTWINVQNIPSGLQYKMMHIYQNP